MPRRSARSRGEKGSSWLITGAPAQEAPPEGLTGASFGALGAPWLFAGGGDPRTVFEALPVEEKPGACPKRRPRPRPPPVTSCPVCGEDIGAAPGGAATCQTCRLLVCRDTCTRHDGRCADCYFDEESDVAAASNDDLRCASNL